VVAGVGKTAWVVSGRRRYLGEAIDDGCAVGVPQGALELSEQIDDGLGLVDAEGRDLDRDGANGRSWFHSAAAAAGVRSDGPSMEMVWQRWRRRSRSASTIFLLPRNSYQASKGKLVVIRVVCLAT